MIPLHSPSGTTSPQPQPSNISCVRWLVLTLQCLDRANTGSLNTAHDSSGGGGIEDANQSRQEVSRNADNSFFRVLLGVSKLSRRRVLCMWRVLGFAQGET